MNINDKIKEIRKRIKELTKHFPYTEDEINILTLCYVAIASVDNDIIDLLDETFRRVFILFNNGQFNKALAKAEGREILTYGGMHINPSSDDNCEYIVVNIFNLPWDSYYTNLIFDIIIHEIKHTLNCIIKSHITRYGMKFNYSGLTGRSEKFCIFLDDENPYLLDESFNCFMTRIYLGQIAYLKDCGEIKDPKIKKILKTFNSDLDGMRHPYKSTYLLEKLFKDEEFFKHFYNAALYRDLDTLYNALSEITKADAKYLEGEIAYALRAYDETGFYTRCLEKLVTGINENYPKRVLELKPSFDRI